MRGKTTWLIVVGMLAVGCSSAGTPATVPETVATTTTAAVTTQPPSTTATTTTQATTTTVDRVAEIEAIFQDLEERRLQALYDGDVEAFKSLFANEEYMERSLGAFDVVVLKVDWQLPELEQIEVLADGESCIAARVRWDYSTTLAGGASTETIEVVERVDDRWGYSYAGEGWTCEGPHPFSS